MFKNEQMENYSVVIDRESQGCQDISFPQIDLHNHSQNFSKVFCGCQQINSKVYMES